MRYVSTKTAFLLFFGLLIVGCDSIVNPDAVINAPQIGYNPEAFDLRINTRVSPITPTNPGGAPTSCISEPELPTGLSLGNDCQIAGTPTATSGAQSYLITASNAAGIFPATIYLQVDDTQPSAFHYTSPLAVYRKGTAIANNSPVVQEGTTITSYSISPSTLPAGLTFVAGVISGTPTALSPLTKYTITANYAGGTATAYVNMSVIDVAPSALVYAKNPAVYMEGIAINPDAPSNKGGAIVCYQILGANSGSSSTSTSASAAMAESPLMATTSSSSSSPTLLPCTSLPATQVILPGLTLNTATGVISGTPTAIVPRTSYLVYGTNTGGTTMVSLSLGTSATVQAVKQLTSLRCYKRHFDSFTNNGVFGALPADEYWDFRPASAPGYNLALYHSIIATNPDTTIASKNYDASYLNVQDRARDPTNPLYIDGTTNQPSSTALEFNSTAIYTVYGLALPGYPSSELNSISMCLHNDWTTTSMFTFTDLTNLDISCPLWGYPSPLKEFDYNLGAAEVSPINNVTLLYTGFRQYIDATATSVPRPTTLDPNTFAFVPRIQCDSAGNTTIINDQEAINALPQSP